MSKIEGEAERNYAWVVKRFPASLLDELREVFTEEPITFNLAHNFAQWPDPPRPILQTIQFKPRSKQSVIEVILDYREDPPLKVLLNAADFKRRYKVPSTGSKLTSLAWVISNRAEEDIFSYPRSKFGDFCQLN